MDTRIATAGSPESQLSEPEEEDCLTGKEGIDIAVIKFCQFVQC